MSARLSTFNRYSCLVKAMVLLLRNFGLWVQLRRLPEDQGITLA